MSRQAESALSLNILLYGPLQEIENENVVSRFIVDGIRLKLAKILVLMRTL